MALELLKKHGEFTLNVPDESWLKEFDDIDMTASTRADKFSDNNLTAKDLSVEMTYLRIGNLNIDNKTELSESIDARIARLIAGEENMVDSGGNVVEQTVGGTLWSNTQNYTPTFGHGHVENFEVDQDKINDEADARD